MALTAPDRRFCGSSRLFLWVCLVSLENATGRPSGRHSENAGGGSWGAWVGARGSYGSRDFPSGFRDDPACKRSFPTGGTFLFVGGRFYPAGERDFPVGETFLFTGKTFGPVGRFDLPTGKEVLFVGSRRFPTGRLFSPAGLFLFPVGKDGVLCGSGAYS